jgi:hypothetical protein
LATEAEIRDLKQRHAARLMARPGVNGVGVERADDGGYVLAVHLESDDPALLADLPEEIDGLPVRYAASGAYRRLAADESEA